MRINDMCSMIFRAERSHGLSGNEAFYIYNRCTTCHFFRCYTMQRRVARQRKGDSNVYRHRNYRPHYHFGPYLHINHRVFRGRISAVFTTQGQLGFSAVMICVGYQIRGKDFDSVRAFDLVRLNTSDVLCLRRQQNARVLRDNRKCMLHHDLFNCPQNPWTRWRTEGVRTGSPIY